MKPSIVMTVFIIGIFGLLAYLIFSDGDVNVEMIDASEQDRTIAVDGTAETYVKPDTASVSFSITKKAPTTDAAMDSVNQRMNQLVSDLGAVGVEEKDIKTTNYSVQPQYSYNDGEQVFEGYRVTQSVKVVIRDIADVSDVLATVNSADVDNVSQLVFYVDDDEAVQEQLREEAIDDAKKNADKLAGDLGVKLDEIVGYHDGSTPPPIQPMYRGDVMMAETQSDTAPAVVPTGENQFVSNVTVIYKIQ